MFQALSRCIHWEESMSEDMKHDPQVPWIRRLNVRSNQIVLALRKSSFVLKVLIDE